mmetsp:Transcript_22552/g.53457  ORF Transcript_22552/g.53457 Transcript_22552/m.53457 type:complete len:220 (-) Transcript_22552:324-983(-)
MKSTGAPFTSTEAMSSSRVSKSVCSILIVSTTSELSGGTWSMVKQRGVTSKVVSEQLLTTLSIAKPFVMVLAGQDTQSADADDPFRYCPSGHNVHVVEPGASAKDPGAHSTHTPGPGASLDVPGSHATHGPPSGPLNPASHTQCSTMVLPAGELLPSGHAEQLRAPDPEYVPAPHSSHHPAPAPALYVPAAHSSHDPDPADSLYLPASHAVHGPPSGPS